MNINKNFNDDNDENKNLMLITNSNNSHFMNGNFKNELIDYNLKAIISNNEKVQIDNNIKEDKNNENNIKSINKYLDVLDMIICNSKFQL